jgi:hypothetical protein
MKKLFICISIILLVLLPLVLAKGLDPQDVDKIAVVYAAKGILKSGAAQRDFTYGVVMLFHPEPKYSSPFSYSFFLDVDGLQMLDYKGNFEYYGKWIDVVKDQEYTNPYTQENFVSDYSGKRFLWDQDTTTNMSFLRREVLRFRQIKGFVYDKYNPYNTADAEVNFVFDRTGKLIENESYVLMPANPQEPSDTVTCHQTSCCEKGPCYDKNNTMLYPCIDQTGKSIMSCESECNSLVAVSSQSFFEKGMEYSDNIYSMNPQCKTYSIEITQEKLIDPTYMLQLVSGDAK